MEKEPFRTELEVRDYECDIQGIVNNSVYQNYMEHARHKFLNTCDVDFNALALKGINLVVIRAEIDYKDSLRGGDLFYVTVKMIQESRIKLGFLQEVRRVSDDKLMAKGKITGVALNERGRPSIPDEIAHLLNQE